MPDCDATLAVGSNARRTLRYGSDNDLTDCTPWTSATTPSASLPRPARPAQLKKCESSTSSPSAGLNDTVALADAHFIKHHTQAQFLREEIREDADWAEVVDQLDLALRA